MSIERYEELLDEVERLLQMGETPCLDDWLDRVPNSRRTEFVNDFQVLIAAYRATKDQTGRAEQVERRIGQQQCIGKYRVRRFLGRGAFGEVYLAYDEDLDREVAIKVHSRQSDLERFKHEAQVLARLKHPNIVGVYDFGKTGDGYFYLVSEYVAGSDLKNYANQVHLSYVQIASIIRKVAYALHNAHTRKEVIVHRDIKPANIIIRADGEPVVVDFGLAWTREECKRLDFAGSPAYMSPEQVEPHGRKLDGQSDIFSLGTVLYELLTGERPFTGADSQEICESILTDEPYRPLLLNDQIPAALDHICLKALAKKKLERYATADVMARELQQFLDASSNRLSALREAEDAEKRQHRKVGRVVAKGLRSFDALDADFFLELLPGPRDSEGLPESIRYWKTRIEKHEPESLTVGLIHGPSGSGKSSFVRAGLLPRLSDQVTPIYVTATADQTERDLLQRMHSVCRNVPDGRDLPMTISALRQRPSGPSGRKVVIVLDQFEQWLHANRCQADGELARGLRQCDGKSLQCIVVVRSDFWAAVSRFMEQLEVSLSDAINLAFFDRFDEFHARKVLVEFGISHGRLPESVDERTELHNTFIERAITDMARDEKVAAIQLALFVDIVKGKPWTPKTLKDIGGTEGVGTAFLVETFDAETANPWCRRHKQLAQTILKSLLPEAGTEIKGRRRSWDELRFSCRRELNKAADFANAMQILNEETRLVTPVDAESGLEEEHSADESGPSAIVDETSYELTHEYLVSSIRRWIYQAQTETRRGRASLLLAERTARWKEKHDNRQLPSLPEYLRFVGLIRKEGRTKLERAMLRRALAYHFVRAWFCLCSSQLLRGRHLVAFRESC